MKLNLEQYIDFQHSQATATNADKVSAASVWWLLQEEDIAILEI